MLAALTVLCGHVVGVLCVLMAAGLPFALSAGSQSSRKRMWSCAILFLVMAAIAGARFLVADTDYEAHVLSVDTCG